MRLVVALLVLAIAVTSCSSPSSDTVMPRQELTLASPCPAGFSQLVLQPDNAQTTPADLSGLLVCRSLVFGRGFVVNRSEQVWTIVSPAGLSWLRDPPTLPATVFRTLTGAVSQTLPVLGLPVEPGTGAEFALPAFDAIRLVLDPSLQAMWQAQQAVTEKLVAKGKDLTVEALARGSPTRRAILTCGLAGYEAGKTLATVNQEDALDAVLGIGGEVRACGKSIRDAERAAAVRRVPPLVSTVESLATTREPVWRLSTRQTMTLSQLGRRLIGRVR